MWIIPALISATCLGFYDICKKSALSKNAVIPVLWLNTIICSIILLPLIIGSYCQIIDANNYFYIAPLNFNAHIFIITKAIIVLSSWICGYYAIKFLPITIVGPINATRPVLTILGGIFIYGECLNNWQIAGVSLAVFSFYLLSRSGKKEGINFKNNKWIALLVLAAILGACSGLYDKYLMNVKGFNKFFVQSWYNIYQMILMTAIWAIIRLPQIIKYKHLTHNKTLHSNNNTIQETSGITADFTKFQWKWSIPLISIFLTLADLNYLYALSQDGALISVISMVRRSSVIVSFTIGALVFKEKNLKGKALDLVFVILSIICLCIGSFYL